MKERYVLVEYDCEDGKCLVIKDVIDDSNLGALGLNHMSVVEYIVEVLNQQDKGINDLKYKNNLWKEKYLRLLMKKFVLSKEDIFMNDKIGDFVKSVTTIRDIKKDVTEISKKYKLDYYGGSRYPRCEYNTLVNGDIVINVIFNLNSIPYKLIRELDEYMGVDCDNISINVGHDLHLRYVLGKRERVRDNSEENN